MTHTCGWPACDARTEHWREAGWTLFEKWDGGWPKDGLYCKPHAEAVSRRRLVDEQQVDRRDEWERARTPAQPDDDAAPLAPSGSLRSCSRRARHTRPLSSLPPRSARSARGYDGLS